MKFLIAYATTEGHSRMIARRVSDHLADRGHAVELLSLRNARDIELPRFDGIILAASVHMGRYQKRLATFAARHAGDLNGRATLFLSVSLAAAGHDAEEWRSLESIAEDLAEATGWHPGRTLQVPGAYKPSEYDILRRLIMRRILAKKDPEADPDADKVYTDWAELMGEVDAWCGSLTAQRGAAE